MKFSNLMQAELDPNNKDLMRLPRAIAWRQSGRSSSIKRIGCTIDFFFQAEDGIRDYKVTGVRRVLFRSNNPAEFQIQPCKLPVPDIERPGLVDVITRSEERRVGKERRSRWSPYHQKKETANYVVVQAHRRTTLRDRGSARAGDAC